MRAVDGWSTASQSRGRRVKCVLLYLAWSLLSLGLCSCRLLQSALLSLPAVVAVTAEGVQGRLAFPPVLCSEVVPTHRRDKGRSEDFPRQRQAGGAASAAPPRHRQRTTAPADAWEERSRNSTVNGRSWQGSDRDRSGGGAGGRAAEESSGWEEGDTRSAGPSPWQRGTGAAGSSSHGGAAWGGAAGAQGWGRDASSQPHPSWRGRGPGSRERGGAGVPGDERGGGRRQGRDGNWRQDRGDAAGARYERRGELDRERSVSRRPMAGNGGGGAGRLFEALRGEALYGVNPVVGALEAGRRRVFTLYVQEGVPTAARCLY